MNKDYQILAPAGSIDQLKMSVQNGCDALYLGVDKFNARMKAPNFTLDNLSYWVDYCHLFGVKVYVTINTSIKNEEFQQAVETLLGVYKRNVDGVILTDLKLIELASKLPKPFEIVASTQLNTHDKFGAEFLKNLGASTVVCSRECSYDDIKQIASVGVNVETFLHGALCVCQSGQCLFSSIVGGNSGNRGLCAQPCRKKYLATNGKQGYLLSPRDMCGLNSAKNLLDCGATTFKIEGRNRRAEYGGATSLVYSNLFKNNFVYTNTEREILLEMYNRGGLHDLSYLEGKKDNVVFPDVQNHIGLQVGKIKGKGFIAYVEINKGDGLKVLHNDKEICGGLATSSGVGYVSAEFSGKVADGMTVCRTTNVKLCNEIANAKRLLPISLQFSAFANSPAKLTANCNGCCVQVESQEVVQKAQSNPLSAQLIAKQLQKMGDFHYTITDIDIKIGDIFMPISQINGLRRDVLEKLTQQIIALYNLQFANRRYASIKIQSSNCVTEAGCLAVICSEASQLDMCDAQYVIFKPEHISQTILQKPSKFYYLDLPSFANLQHLEELIDKSKWGIVCHNIGQVQFARAKGLRYIAGSGLNIFNDYMADMFSDADTFVYSLELTLSEMSQFNNKSGLIFVDGKIPLMKVVHCPYQVVYRCNCNSCKYNGSLTYTDELGNTFEIIRRRDVRCTFEILNGKKLSVVNHVKKQGRYLVDYNELIVDHYKNLNNGVVDHYVETQPYTKGRLFNKIN